MMNETEIKEHINRLDSNNLKVYSDVEQIELIRAYIYDRKGVDIGNNVNRPTGRVVHVTDGRNINGMTHDVVLLQQMHDCALEWFAKKYQHAE